MIRLSSSTRAPRRHLSLAGCSIGLAIAALPLSAQRQDAALAGDRSARQVSGTIRVCGSPQMAELLKLYQAGFALRQPRVRFENQLESTLTAVSSVSAGRAEIGLLGRELWPEEAAAFAALKGHSPLAIKVATGSYDVPKATFALMVFVPRANPIESLSMDELAKIFASSDEPIRTWGGLGLRGEWARRPIHLYGFTKDNDKSRIFRRLVFKQGEKWNPELKEFNNETGSRGADAGELILRAVADDPDAIGISNVHYATRAVKLLALSPMAGLRPVPPTRDSVTAGTYPLTRAVYMVVDPGALSSLQSPNGAAVLDFLRYVLSRQGRQAVIDEGNYLPLTPAAAQHELDALDAHAR